LFYTIRLILSSAIIKIDFRRFLPRAIRYICCRAIIATPVRATRAQANKQAGIKKVKAIDKLMIKRQANCRKRVGH